MGVPTTAQYIITSTLAAPALGPDGVPMFSAHLFCLYFGVLADVTPPVALATYASAGIAKSEPLKTGFTALLVAAAGFIVPYMFIYNPGLLLQGSVFEIVFAAVTALIAVIGLSAAVQGYFADDVNIIERILLIAVPFLYQSIRPLSNLIGVVIVVAVFAKQKSFGKKENRRRDRMMTKKIIKRSSLHRKR